MVSIFGDESADSSSERVYALAALHGTDEEWERLRTRWRERTGGKVFHSADCESGYGDFRGMHEDERHKLHLDLTQILAENGLIGWGAAIDLKGCAKVFPDTLPNHNPGSALLRTMVFHIDRVLLNYPSEHLKIAFDRNQKMEYNARQIFQYLADDSETASKVRLPSAPEFVTRDEIGVQAADIWVRELMKFMDGSLAKGDDYKPRPQWNILMGSGRFGGDLLFGEMFQSMKDQMSVLEEKTGMSGDNYRFWLRQKKRQDNQSNRLDYMAHMAAKDRASERQDGGEGLHRKSSKKQPEKVATAKPTVIFDTSGINCLMKNSNGQEIIERLSRSHYVRITETSISELSATPDADDRKKLIDVCEQLMEFGECLLPHQEIMHEMAECNWRYKSRFLWEEVEARSPDLENEIKRRKFLSQDDLAEESSKYAKTQKKTFKQIFRDSLEKFRDDFEEAMKKEPDEMTLDRFIQIVKADGGPFWKSISGFYARTHIFGLDEIEAKEFIARCPPYHAIALGIDIAQYQYGIPRAQQEEYDAGPFDLFMAIYLPYTDFFVTNDPGQTNALRAIAQEVGLSVRILNYDEFCKELLGTSAEAATE